ncbi:cyanophycinase [Novosphingobium jiangmenense]|uniref:Cyanophycinase n=1 Tax=Novosphingobium jiangmenense TaxID=2791981 RepID=A0ABS0HD39_9SPHN|nr:cyanophycinase [Novosphingobium jiangmenense]MBF9149886.1 cyanophycinase [Novosphingobium jiangmenense]
MHRPALLLALVLLASPARAEEPETPPEFYTFGDPAAPSPGRPSPGKPTPGLLLMGGGKRDRSALQWFFAHAGRGHVVIISASYGKDMGEEFFRTPDGPASVEVIVFHARSQSADPAILRKLARADAVFIAGGDQARYVRFWQGTEVARLLDAHVVSGKPLGGTSAGLAVLGEALYGAMDGNSITSPEALADPLGPGVTIERDFLHLVRLAGIITDSHFTQRDRLGRLFAFVAKAQALTGKPITGIGIDEDAALMVEADGTARLASPHRDGAAWIVDGSALRLSPQGAPLTANSVTVTLANAASTVHLPSARVENPAAIRRYEVRAGKLLLKP